jgi:TrmH family RNA methyltransferase
MLLENCRVVLVEPRIAANIGATARVMLNFGVRALVLVNPAADPADREARKLSTHGEEILDEARTVPDFGAAVADCILVVGMSARIGGPVRRQSVGFPEQIVPRIAETLARGRVALVFGREANGLTDDEVTRCHYLINIPTNPEYPALNLAQAVAITLYELHRLAAAPGDAVQSETPATFAAQERMFASLRAALEEIHFLYGPKADALMHGLRHLLGRAQPTDMEVDLLLGLARQIRWLVNKKNASDQ